MQYHLDGFRPGDPSVAPAFDPGAFGPPDDVDVDVLVVGCGPAGLTLAAQLSAFPSISTRIVDLKSGPLELGQADGVACRSMEMFEAFGFADRVAKEAYWVNETSFWRPAADDPMRIERADRIQDVEDGLSEFPHTILNQARIHDFYLDVMARSARRLEPDYCLRFEDLTVHDDHVLARLRLVGSGGALIEGDDAVESVRARYVVGCDGARSAVRGSLGNELIGDSANKLWGVMDVLAVTDFPDIRLKAAVQSATQGSVLIIPREGGYLVRIYTEIGELAAGERARDRGLTIEELIAAAQRILSPYTLDVKEVAWWSAYEIGQRVAGSFDDVGSVPGDGGDQEREPRVFIVGDACHTHSPKAGQGMNVSMADSFNLGWKLASVLLGRADPALLRTYTTERQAVAAELIEFDRDMAKLFSLRAGQGDRADADDAATQAEFQRYFAKHGRYTAGVETHYGPSIITASGEHQTLAAGLPIGKRFHSAPVVRLADAKPLHLAHVVKADGRWRVFLFADANDRGAPGGRVAQVCDFLEHDAASPLVRHTPAGEDIDSVIDVRAVFQQNHRTLDVGAMPSLLRPTKGRYGLIDHEKIFCGEAATGQHYFDARGIDRTAGCMVVVRPDQYVSAVLPLDVTTGCPELASFFGTFLRPF